MTMGDASTSPTEMASFRVTKKGSVGLRYFSLLPCRNGLIGATRIPSTSSRVTRKNPATAQTMTASRLQISRQRSSSRWSRKGISPARAFTVFGIRAPGGAHPPARCHDGTRPPSESIDVGASEEICSPGKDGCPRARKWGRAFRSTLSPVPNPLSPAVPARSTPRRPESAPGGRLSWRPPVTSGFPPSGGRGGGLRGRGIGLGGRRLLVAVQRGQRQLALVAAHLAQRSQITQLAQFLGELLHVGEVAVHAGVAHVGDLVAHLHPRHHHLADLAAADLAGLAPVQLALDVLDDGLDLGGGDGALGAGHLDAAQQLAVLERLGFAVALHHLQRALLDVLVGGEAPAAAQALAPAPHRAPL